MNQALKVLAVEDSEDDVLLLKRTLAQGGYDAVVKQVDTAGAMEEALKEEGWDIIISDYSMPRFNGLDALDLMQHHKLDYPFILLSGAIGEETAVEAMKRGANDYIMKDNKVRLVPAIQRALTDAKERQKRRQAEQEIKRVNSQLKKAIMQLQDSQAQLLQSEKMAAIGQLVSGVAHEINNPLGAISMCGELLLKNSDAARTQELIGIVNRETERVIAIVDNLLSFARKHEPEKTYISINECLTRTAELRAYEMKIHNINLVLTLDPDLPKTMADFFQLQQVFLNLIQNAEQVLLESGEKGNLEIETRASGDMIEIVFADDGPGIPGCNINKIFEPFFTTKDVGKGTGLGLSICYGIIQEHSGQITVQSKVGQGTTFTICLPIVPENMLPEESSVKKAKNKTILSQHEKPMSRYEISI